MLTEVNMNMTDMQEALSFLLQQSGLTTGDVIKQMADKKRADIINQHPYNIFRSESDGRWRTYVKDVEGKRKLIAKKTKEKLEDAIVEYYEKLEHEEKDVPITIRSLYNEWLEYKQLHAASSSYIKRIEADWRNHYADTDIVDVPIKELTKLQVDVWVHTLIKKVDGSKKQYYNISMILRQVLDYAVDKELLDSNPLDKVKINTRQVFTPVKKKDSKTQVFTRDEVKALQEEAWKAFYEGHNPKNPLTMLAVMAMFQLGTRIGEITCLKFSDIEGDEICVQRMFRYQQKEIVPYTKAHNAYRYVILTEEAKYIIDVARQYKEERGLDCQGYIFSVDDEVPLSYYSVRKAFAYLCQKIDTVNKSSHKARKTYVTALIDANVNVNQVRSMVGHSSEKTTYASYCYTRETPEENKKLIEKALS